MNARSFITLFLAGALLTAGIAVAQEDDLFSMSLDDLLNMEITSVSKKAERLQDVASAIYVITEEDIRRSGATRIQEVLALAPGVWLSDMSYEQPFFAIREVPTAYPQSVNILMDGVPITDPVRGVDFKGMQLPISEIKQVEIIKGPGGTIYGANSATGVVNIITKKADEYDGFQVTVNAGTRMYAEPTVSYGTKLGDKTSVAGYVSLKNHHGFDNPLFDDAVETMPMPLDTGSTVQRDSTVSNKYYFGDDGIDKRLGYLGGLLITSEVTPKLTLRGQVFARTSSAVEPGHFSWRDSSGIVTSVGDTTFSSRHVNQNLTVNAYADYSFNDNHSAFFHAYHTRSNIWYTGTEYRATTGITDFEVQDNLGLRQDSDLPLELISGANTRIVNFDIGDEHEYARIRFTDPQNTEFLYAGFVQGKLSYKTYFDFIAGIKGESWSLIGGDIELLPTLKFSLHPTPKYTVWGSWSRSITTPGYLQSNLEVGLTDFGFSWMTILSTENLKPTVYRTLEGGVRTSVVPKLSLDFGAYYSQFSDRIATTRFSFALTSTSPNFGDGIHPMYYTNLFEGSIFGGEAVVKTEKLWNVLRLEGSYSLFIFDEEVMSSVADSLPTRIPSIDSTGMPDHVVKFKAYLDLPQDYLITVSGQWSSSYLSHDEYNFVNQQAAGNDGSVNWQAADEESVMKLNIMAEKLLMDGRLRVSLWGKNVLHNEPYNESFTPGNMEYPHAVHATYGGGLTYKF